MMNFSFLVEFGFAVGLILGVFLGNFYRTLLDKWKYRKSKSCETPPAGGWYSTKEKT